jgi:hypothetical protein
MKKIKLLSLLILCLILLESIPFLFAQTSGSSNCKELNEYCSPLYNCCYGLTCSRKLCKVSVGGQCRTSRDCTHDALCILSTCKAREKISPIELPLGVLQDKFFDFVDWLGSPDVSTLYVGVILTIIFISLVLLKYLGKQEEY